MKLSYVFLSMDDSILLWCDVDLADRIFSSGVLVSAMLFFSIRLIFYGFVDDGALCFNRLWF